MKLCFSNNLTGSQGHPFQGAIFAHEIELIAPFQALVTVTRDPIEPVPGRCRADYAAGMLDDRAR